MSPRSAFEARFSSATFADLVVVDQRSIGQQEAASVIVVGRRYDVRSWTRERERERERARARARTMARYMPSINTHSSINPRHQRCVCIGSIKYQIEVDTKPPTCRCARQPTRSSLVPRRARAHGTRQSASRYFSTTPSRRRLAHQFAKPGCVFPPILHKPHLIPCCAHLIPCCVNTCSVRRRSWRVKAKKQRQ